MTAKLSEATQHPSAAAVLDSLTRKHSTFGYASCKPKMYEVNGSVIAVWLSRRGHSVHEYDVALVSGEWPSDADLITACDGHFPKVSHFGGNVHVCEELRRVVGVYVD